jgi:hypothetical protein
VRGKNHEQKIDTGNFFPKNQKSKKKKTNNKTTAPASITYAPTIHGKYMQFLTP